MFMPNKEEVKKRMGVWWIALLVLVILDLIFLNYMVFSIKNPFSSKEGSSKSIYDVDNNVVSLSEKVDLIRANMLTCSNDNGCKIIFDKTGYSCSTGMPKCASSFCVCG